ncbi:lipase [Salinibacillus aidingensis]|uniref:triacylglycerol lipase n=1 Tax=Salinibacillus aidingensis TaxID=237684 RepID=A0ABN1BBV5_9BACI
MIALSRVMLILSLVLALLSVPFTSLAEENQKKNSGNSYPIVMVHGLMGWGEGEMGGFHYWGGLQDIQANLNEQGFQTYVATVGPVSSNWDRAVELYHYINGGTVDYGARHAKEHGHDQYGKTFPGIYTEWNQKNKIHLVGHSMGGQTIRTLVDLLKDGSEAERSYAKEQGMELSPLFKDGKSQVQSVTSLATPHNGSTFADEELVVPLIKKMVMHAAAMGGLSQDSLVYDFKLEHWGLEREEGESFLSYADRIYNSSVWERRDISLYDLTTPGAKELNEWVGTHPDVYYFSFIGQATYEDWLTGRSLPSLSMSAMLVPSSLFMGSYTRNHPDPAIDESWWPNDGLVNVVSGKYPFSQKHEAYDYGEKAQKGVWNHFSVQNGWDHLDHIGINAKDALGIHDLDGFYQKLAAHLQRLP